MEITIRRLFQDDDSVFDRVAPDVFDLAVDRRRLSAYLGAPGHYMIVALAGGEIVGQCAAVVHRHPDKPTELYIDEVGVTPALRRRGIARRMLDAMFALGRELGCEEAWVGTEPDNIAARALYETASPPPEPAETFVMYLYDLGAEN